MPFGLTNASPFYTAITKNFKDEWDKLFVVTVLALVIFEDKSIMLSVAMGISIGVQRLIYDSKAIIDNTLLLCDNKKLLIMYFK